MGQRKPIKSINFAKACYAREKSLHDHSRLSSLVGILILINSSIKSESSSKGSCMAGLNSLRFRMIRLCERTPGVGPTAEVLASK